jgi:hypothetical protein
MGNDKHELKEFVKIPTRKGYHKFIVIPNNFPLAEEGLIGKNLMSTYKFQITNQHLILDGQRHLLYECDGKSPYAENEEPDTRNDKDKTKAIRTPSDKPNKEQYVPSSEERSRNQHAQTLKPETAGIINIPRESDKKQCDRILMTLPSDNDQPDRVRLLTSQLRLEHIEPKIRNTLEQILIAYRDVFRLQGDPLPVAPKTQHVIKLTKPEIIHDKGYRPAIAHREEIDRQMTQMLQEAIIKESNSLYNSPLWVVPKKQDASGKTKWRIVVDFRKLNQYTNQDAYPLPCIDEILEQLGSAQYFSSLDLSSGFHQIRMEANSQKYTAFSTPKGHYEFNRMPFGLKNAPATFQRMMDEALQGLTGRICFVYLDDIIIYGRTPDEHAQRLLQVLQRIREKGLRLQQDKCEFLRPELEYLGHVVTPEGIKPNEGKIRAIKNHKKPHNEKTLRGLLGLVGYYRKFIKNFSMISAPLTQLLKKTTDWQWSPECETSYETLKSALCKEPVLRYPDFNETFTLTTDASNYGIGGVLSQKGHPCSFVSFTLNEAERNYSATEKECLAIVKCVRKLRPYLIGKHFIIETDHQVLRWLFNVKDPSSKLVRWRLLLEELDYEIRYIKGKENKIADELSRALCINRATAVDLTLIYEDYLHWNEELNDFKLKILKNTNKGKWYPVTKTDETDGMQLGEYNEQTWVEKLYMLYKRMKRNKDPFRIVINDPMMTKGEINKIERILEFIISEYAREDMKLAYQIRELTDEKKETLIKEAHGTNLTHHFGEDKSINRLTNEYEWKGMRYQVKEYVKQCEICQRSKLTRVRPRAPMTLTDTPRRGNHYPEPRKDIDIYSPYKIYLRNTLY